MKTRHFFFGIASAAMMLAGCEANEIKEAPVTESTGSTFELIADIAQTKTTMDANYKVSWKEGDKIYMVTSDETWGKPYAEDNSAATVAEFIYNDGKFTTQATIADSDDPYTFYAMYCNQDNKSWHRGAGSSDKLFSTQSQDCSDPTAHIGDYDALVGSFEATVPMEGMAEVTMQHIYTLMQVNVKNATGNEIAVTKFEMTAKEGTDLTGIFNIDFSKSAISSVKTGYGESITVNIENGTVAAGESLPVYFVMAPLADYSGDITFKVTDSNGNTYTKTATLNNISFEAGKYNTTPYTISEADEVEDEIYGVVEVDGAFEDGGKYVFAFKDGQDGTYTFINNKGTSNTADAGSLSVVSGAITNPDAQYVFTAEADAEGYKLKNSNGNYIYYSGSSTTLNTNNTSTTTWTPAFIAASYSYKITTGNRYIGFNGTSKAMAYATSNFKDQIADGLALEQYAGAISVFKLGYTPVVVPKIMVSELELTAVADAESIEIPYKTENVSGTITVTVTSDEGEMINGEPVVDTEKVTLNLNANESSTDKTATVTLSYEGAEVVVITITQYSAATAGNGFASLYEDVTSTDSNNPDEFVINISDAVVTYVNGSNAFVEDATAGILIYKSSHGLKEGDKMSGTLTGKAYVRYGVHQISDFDLSAVETSSDAIVPVTTISIADLLENYSSYISKRVKIEGATVTDAVTGTSDKNGSVEQNESSINLYNNSQSVSFVANDVVDFIAYPSYYNEIKQLAIFEAPVSKKVAAPAIACSDNIVTITCATDGATLYYAIGDATYSEYTEPFEIEDDCTVKAYATKDGMINSDETTKELTWVDPNGGGEIVAGGGSSDFDTVTKTSTSYSTSTTTAGWKADNCAVLKGGSSDSNPMFKMIGDDSNRAFCMNGKNSAVGTITSPNLENGCGKISFNYGLPYSDTKIKFKVEIKQNDVSVKEFIVENNSATKLTKYSFDGEVNISGTFTIVFTNLSPSNSSSNKDRTAIWDVTWTGYTE